MDEMDDPLGLRDRVRAFQERVERTLQTLEGLAAELEDAKALKDLVNSYRPFLKAEDAAARARAEGWQRIENGWSGMSAAVDHVARNDEKQDLAIASAEKALGELRERTEGLGRRLQEELLGVEQRFGTRQNEFEGRLNVRIEERDALLRGAIEKAMAEADDRSKALEALVVRVEKELQDAVAILRQEVLSQVTDLRTATAKHRDDVAAKLDQAQRGFNSLRQRLLLLGGVGVCVAGIALVVAISALVKAS